LISKYYFALLLLLANAPMAADSEESLHSARTLVHLLDYLAQDYAGAVSDGKVISVSEYAEQKEFVAKAWQMEKEFPRNSPIAVLEPELRRLKETIEAKGSPDSVFQLARKLKQEVLSASGIPTAPTQWPSRAHGQELFSQNCTPCHGTTGHGDGPAGIAFTPRPANFHNEERMSQLSPFQVFNTIRLGVDGTGMQPFPKLTESEVWDLAFYVSSLRYEGDSALVEKTPQKGPQFGLQQIAVSSDRELAARFPGSDHFWLAHIRLQTEEPVQNLSNFIGTANTLLDEALTQYRKGDTEKSRNAALLAYLEGVEPLEARLRALDPEFVLQLEAAMMKVRASIQSNENAVQVENSVISAKGFLRQADDLMAKKTLPPWTVFLATVGILMRESFEALLVILAILGVVRATGTKKAAAYVHGGWIAAVAAGFAAWFLSEWVSRLSGAGREMTEGISSLVAVVVLLYMGFWMHSKSEIGKWKAFVSQKLKGTMTQRGLLGLTAFSFLVVFREAFETVLFLSALSLEGEGTSKAVLAGTLFSLTLTLLIAWIFLRTSKKLPVRIFFSISSVIMAILAFMLIGKGVHALQEAGVLSVTTAPWYFRFDFLGWYPTWETWGSQLVVLLVTAVMLWPRTKPSPMR